AALALSKNPLANNRVKHIDIKYHFVREAVEKDWITVSYVPTTSMPANGLTKLLGKPKHISLIECSTDLSD
ncbi:uncharacterized protein VP01_5765g1, partial [Puccinia sorghi]